jgi:stage V sporulation protein AC
MNKEEYKSLVKKNTPKEDKLKDYFNTFLMGGLIGLFSEIIKILLINTYNMKLIDATSYILLFLIFMSCFLTSLGFFDKIVSKYKCGLIIPITGFAHSIMSASLDYKKDGLITGLGSNFFKLAGSVLLYGIVAGFIFGIVKVILYA